MNGTGYIPTRHHVAGTEDTSISPHDFVPIDSSVRVARQLKYVKELREKMSWQWRHPTFGLAYSVSSGCRPILCASLPGSATRALMDFGFCFAHLLQEVPNRPNRVLFMRHLSCKALQQIYRCQLLINYFFLLCFIDCYFACYYLYQPLIPFRCIYNTLGWYIIVSSYLSLICPNCYCIN